VLIVPQAGANDRSPQVVNGHHTNNDADADAAAAADVTVARVGDETAQTHSRHSTHTSHSASSAFTGIY